MTILKFDFDGERYAVEFAGAIDVQVAAGVLCLAGASDDFRVHRVDSLGPVPEHPIVALIEARMNRALHGIPEGVTERMIYPDEGLGISRESVLVADYGATKTPIPYWHGLPPVMRLKLPGPWPWERS